MPDYTTRYTFEVDLLERDIARKAQQIAKILEQSLTRTTPAASKLAVQERELSAAFEATNAAITSQTRRLSYHMKRLEDVAGRVRFLAYAERDLYEAMTAAGEGVFDSLVDSARRAFDEIVGHSILRDLLIQARAVYEGLQTAGSVAFVPAIAGAKEFLQVMREVRTEVSVGGRISGGGYTWAGGGGATPPPPIDMPSVLYELPSPDAIKEITSAMSTGLSPMEKWFDTFNTGLNQATMQWFGLRRLGYGLESIGRSMTRTGKAIFNAMVDAAKSYLTFNESATRAAMAMEMQVGMQDKLEESILDVSQTLGLFAPEELAEGLRIWAAGTGEVIQTETALNAILERTVDLQKLAAMNAEELGDVTQVTGGIMHGFGMETEDVTHIVEILNFVAAKTFATVGDVGAALKFVGPLARQAGVSFEEVAATIGILADENIVASRSGRALRQMFIQMIKPTDAHNKALNDALGLSEELGQTWQQMVYPEGVFIGLAKYIDLIAAHTEEWTTQQRAALLATMATANELPVLTTLVEQQIEARKEGANVIAEETAALRGAHTLMGQMWTRYEESDAARVKRMQSRWDAAVKAMGKSVIEIGVPIVEAAVELLMKVAYLVEKYPWLATAAMGAAGLNLAFGGLLTMMGQLFGVAANLMIMKAAFAGFGTSVGGFGAAVKAFAIAVAAMRGGAAVTGAGGAAVAGGAAAAAGLPTWLTRLGLAGFAVKFMLAPGLEGMFEQVEEEMEVVQNRFYELFAKEPSGVRAFVARSEEGLAIIQKILGENEKWISQGYDLDRVLKSIRGEYQEILNRLPMIGKGPGMQIPEYITPEGEELYPSGMGIPPEVIAQKEINDKLVDLQENFEETIAKIRQSAVEKRADAQRKWEEWQRDAWDTHLKRNTDLVEKYEEERARAIEAFRLSQLKKEAEFTFREARIIEDHNRKLEEAADDHQQGVLEDAAQHAEKLADLAEAYNEKREEAEEKHQLKMQRMERDHQRALLQAEEDYQQRVLENAEEHAERLADLKEQYQEAEVEARERLNERLADLEKGYQESVLDAAEDHAERLADLKEKLLEQEEEDAKNHADRLADIAERLHEDEVDAAEKHADRIADIEEDYLEDVEDDAKNHADRLEDLKEDYEKAEKEDAERHAGRMQDIDEDYQEAIEDDAKKHADRVQDIEEDFQKDSERAEEDYQRRMERLKLDHLERLADLIRNRDARGLLLEMRNYKRRVDEEEEDYKTDKERRRYDFEERLAEERERYEELRKRRKEEYEERLQDEIDDYEKRKKKRRDNYLDRVKDEEERYEEQKKKRWEDYQDRLREEAERYEEWKAKRQEEYEDQVADEEDRYRDQQERRQKDYADQLQDLIDAFNEASDERKENYDKQRQKLLDNYTRDAADRADEYAKQRQEEAARYAEQVADAEAQYKKQKDRRQKAYEEKRADALEDYALATEDRKDDYEKQVEEEVERNEEKKEARQAQYEAERKETQDEYDFRAARRAEDYKRARQQDAEAFARKQAEAVRQFNEAVAAEEIRYNDAYTKREQQYDDLLILLQKELAEEERLAEDAHREKLFNLAGFFGDIETSYQQHYDRLLDDVEDFLWDYQLIWDQLQDLQDNLPLLPTIPPYLPPILQGIDSQRLMQGARAGDGTPITTDPSTWPEDIGRLAIEAMLKEIEELEELRKYGEKWYVGDKLQRFLDEIDDHIAQLRWQIENTPHKRIEPWWPMPPAPEPVPRTIIPIFPQDPPRYVLGDQQWKLMAQKFNSNGGDQQISIHMTQDNTWHLPPGTPEETAENVREIAYAASYEAVADAMQNAKARLGR